MSKEHSRFSRRTVLKTGSILATGGVFATGSGSAQQHYELEIEQYPVEEYVVITNVAAELDADITGFSINFEAEDDDYNQVRELAGEVVLAAGESITVPTGAREVDADNIVELADPYDGEVLNNDGSDVVTLLDTDGQVVWSTADNATYTLTLTVIGPNEETVADASVGIVTYDGGVDVTRGTTDENGQATFELRNGDYEISIGSEGYAQPSDDRLVRINGEDVERTIQLVTAAGGGDEEETYTVNASIEYSDNTPATGTVTALGQTNDLEPTEESTPESPAIFNLPEGTYNMIARIPNNGGYGEETIPVGPDGIEELTIVTDGPAPSDDEDPTDDEPDETDQDGDDDTGSSPGDESDAEVPSENDEPTDDGDDKKTDDDTSVDEVTRDRCPDKESEP